MAQRVGLIAGSYKPFHAGHYELIRRAASENDVVKVFVGLADRGSVSGQAMEKIWKEAIEPILPGNVEVTYGGNPIGNIYKILGDANEEGSQDEFSIYSDPNDIEQNFNTLKKYAGNLIANGQIKLEAVSRASTVDVSGTQMRKWFDEGDVDMFVANLPKGIDGEFVWSTLKAMPPVAKPKVAKKKVKGEGLIREFVKLQLG
jgi:cytidyltransferase-like protein